MPTPAIAKAALRAAHRINERWTTDKVDIAEFAERDAEIIVEELEKHFAPAGQDEAH